MYSYNLPPNDSCRYYRCMLCMYVPRLKTTNSPQWRYCGPAINDPAVGICFTFLSQKAARLDSHDLSFKLAWIPAVITDCLFAAASLYACFVAYLPIGLGIFISASSWKILDLTTTFGVAIFQQLLFHTVDSSPEHKEKTTSIGNCQKVIVLTLPLVEVAVWWVLKYPLVVMRL